MVKPMRLADELDVRRTGKQTPGFLAETNRLAEMGKFLIAAEVMLMKSWDIFNKSM